MNFRTLAVSFFVALLQATPVVADESGLADRIELNGDFRLRYEGIDEEFENQRNRMRFRARLGLQAEVQDNVRVVVQFATGGDNPVSTNQSFDDGFSTKDIGLDLAYVDWQVNNVLSINAGKMKNPLFRAGGAPLIWDGDLNPEGFAADFDSGIFFATAAGFLAEERGSSDDSLLYAMQGGVKVPVGDHTKLTVGVGYFAYTDTAGNSPFYNGSAKGNSVDLNGNYLYEYKNSEVFAQLDTRLSDWALQLFAQFTQNHELSNQDTAYALGAKLGTAKNKGDMEFAVIFQDIEADAVVGSFNDSDFGGSGTDSEGFILKTKYGLSKKIFLGGTFFVNNIDRFQGAEHDYSRVQIDLEFKFD